MGVMAARSRRRMVLMLLATPVVGYAYILRRTALRRSSGLSSALVMLMVMLYRRRPSRVLVCRAVPRPHLCRVSRRVLELRRRLPVFPRRR